MLNLGGIQLIKYLLLLYTTLCTLWVTKMLLKVRIYANNFITSL